jgi:hypothetical protein
MKHALAPRAERRHGAEVPHPAPSPESFPHHRDHGTGAVSPSVV